MELAKGQKVITTSGFGEIYSIEGDIIIVEFDYKYLVDLKRNQILEVLEAI